MFRKIQTACKQWTCPVGWRIGPNPFLTVLALLAAGGELIFLFLRKPVDYLNHEFLVVCIVAGVLWFWLTFVWILWLILQAIQFSHLKKVVRRFLFVSFSLLLIVLAAAYSLAWFSFLYSGVFPNAEALDFIESGSETDLNFILFVINQTVSNALAYLIGFCVLLVILVPVGLRYAIRSTWSDTASPARSLPGILTWILTGFGSFFFLALLTADWNSERLETHMARLKTQVNPVVTFAASALDPLPTEEVRPDLDLGLLTPINQTDVVNTPNSITTAPHVLYLAIESLRADVLFASHQGIEIMPHLNALARKSIQFTRGYANSTHTDYALPAYLSSLYPLRSQKHRNSQRNSPYPKTLIYEALKPYGYTAGIITSDSTGWCNMIDFMWSKDLNVFYDSANLPATFIDETEYRGYVDEHEDQRLPGAGTSDDARTVSYSMKWLGQKFASGQPTFLHLFFQQTHFSYNVPAGAPEPFQPCEVDFPATFDAYPRDKVDVMRNAYFNAAHYVDAQIGRLLEFLEKEGQLDNTIIVLCGDHGEAFLEHNFITHSRPPYEEFIHVPMLIFAPMVGPARQVDYPVEQIDMPPTLCGLLGLPIPPGYQGIDVFSANRPALEDRYLFSHAEVPFGKGEAVVYAGRWKYLVDRRRRTGYLFDLQKDPGELHDIKKSNPQMAAKLRRRVTTWRENQLAYYKYNMYYEYYYPPNPNLVRGQ